VCIDKPAATSVTLRLEIDIYEIASSGDQRCMFGDMVDIKVGCVSHLRTSYYPHSRLHVVRAIVYKKANGLDLLKHLKMPRI